VFIHSSSFYIVFSFATIVWRAHKVQARMDFNVFNTVVANVARIGKHGFKKYCTM
jgi:hypothetical protein